MLIAVVKQSVEQASWPGLLACCDGPKRSAKRKWKRHRLASCGKKVGCRQPL